MMAPVFQWCCGKIQWCLKNGSVYGEPDTLTKILDVLYTVNATLKMNWYLQTSSYCYSKHNAQWSARCFVTRLPNILLDSTVVVSLKVEVITILSEDFWQPVTVQVLALSQVYCHHKQVLLKQHLKRQGGDNHATWSTVSNLSNSSLLPLGKSGIFSGGLLNSPPVWSVCLSPEERTFCNLWSGCRKSPTLTLHQWHHRKRHCRRWICCPGHRWSEAVSLMESSPCYQTLSYVQK